MSASKSMRALVAGRVQGVGYRYFTQKQAAALGLRGYVRNLADGRVEVGAVGPAAALDALVEVLRQGPVGSRVESCQVSWGEEIAAGSQFEVRY